MAATESPSYDGFLSYSHAADDLLAPRLQAGLQRFAKPWWKRRALHVFRDEASLSANPHLWSSITNALDDSEWFVLLLSPEAAESQWVNREIDYWKEHKDPQKILPAVTDGTFTWADGDVAGDAVPPSLQGVFEDEPRWVDLRFARTETQLDLRHTRFRDAVADIAAAIRRVPKDELESEEIHQHRRTVRTAWTAGLAILALGVAASVGAIVAYNAQQDAQDERDRAQQDRDRAVAAEEETADERDRAVAAEEEAERLQTIAEQEAGRAEENEATAVRAAKEARARELAAAALLNLDFDPERSILLAIEAVETADSADRPDLQEPIIALRQAVAASRVVSRINSGWFVAYSPDGSLIAGSDGSDGVDTAIWDAETGEQIHVLAAPEGRWMYNPTFSPDGRHLVVPYEPMDSETDQAGPTAVVWDVVTGEPVATFGGPDVGVGPGIFATFSPDGTMLAVNTGDANWVSGSSDASLVVWDLASGTERYRIAHPEAHSPSHSFSPDGTLLAVPMISDDPLAPSRVELHDALTGMEIDSFDVGELRPPTTAFDPSGLRLAALSDWPGGLMIWDIASGETVLSVTLEGQQHALAWSPDGDVIAVAGTEGVPRLLDAATGDEMLFLLGHDTAIYSLAFSPDGERLAAAAEYTDTLVWDITATGSREVATLATPYPDLGKMRYDADGNKLLVMTASPDFIGSLFQLDATTGEVMAEIPDQLTGYPLQVRLVPEAGLVATLNVDGTAALHDSQTFEPVATLPEGYFALDVSRDGTRVVLRELDTGEAIVVKVGSWETLATIGTGNTYYARFSPDGNLVTGYGHVGVFDIETQSDLATPDEFSMIAANWSPDGSFLAARTRGGRLGMVDVAALRDGATFEEALVFDIDAHDGLIQDPVLFNRDGSLIATWGNIDRHFKVWSTEDGQLVADLGERDWSGFDFHPNGRHLVTGGPDGTIRILTLDTTELLDIARNRVTRGFTDDECVTYYIDPCPDLQAIRGG